MSRLVNRLVSAERRKVAFDALEQKLLEDRQMGPLQAFRLARAQLQHEEQCGDRDTIRAARQRVAVLYGDYSIYL